MQLDSQIPPQNIPLAAIHVAPGHNPRKHFKPAKFERLVESIKADGLIQAITVRPNPHGDGFELISGERRLRACRQLNFADIPAVVRDVDDATSRRLALLENLDRDNLSVADEALSAQGHVDAYDGDHDAAARALGWSTQKLKHRLRLLHCAEDVLNALGEEHITLAHAELLAMLPSEAQLKALPRILERNVSVAELREQINGFSTPLAQAVFDRAAAGCGTCPFNSDFQSQLFEAHVGRDARCGNRECFSANTEKALEAKRTELRDEFGTVAFLTEKVPGATIPLVIHGESGVGTTQYAKCRGCAFRGCVIDNRVGATTGKVDQPLCFDRACHTERVEEHRATLNPPSTEAEASTPEAQASVSPGTTRTPTKAKAATGSKKPAKAAAAKATPAAVADQHAATLRRALTTRMQTDPTLVLSLALYGLMRTVADESGRDGIDAVTKELKLSVPKGKGGAALHTQIPAALVQLEKPALQQAIVAAATLLFERNADEIVFNRKVNRRSLVASLVEQAQIDLVPFVRVDEAFLSAHTKTALEDVLEEAGFAAWMKAQDGGEKRLKGLLAGSKADLVKGVLAAAYPGFATYLPSALGEQSASWRKNP
jgi:ParB family chromosome partitioning protein